MSNFPRDFEFPKCGNCRYYHKSIIERFDSCSFFHATQPRPLPYFCPLDGEVNQRVPQKKGGAL